jgi:hypothetical protein
MREGGLRRPLLVDLSEDVGSVANGRFDSADFLWAELVWIFQLGQLAGGENRGSKQECKLSFFCHGGFSGFLERKGAIGYRIPSDSAIDRPGKDTAALGSGVAVRTDQSGDQNREVEYAHDSFDDGDRTSFPGDWRDTGRSER